MKSLLEVNNFDNGQWTDLIASDKSNSVSVDTTNVEVINIDANINYYLSQKQQELMLDRKFVDRSSPIIVNNTIHNFFTEQIEKDRTDKNGYVTASLQGIDTDKFRQGVEITLPKHVNNGTVKISAGTPGHFSQILSFGTTDNILTDNNYFQELILFNPIEFISIQSSNKLLEQLINFPIVTSDSNQRENEILNGTIEPFPIRPIIAHMSIYFPTEPRGIKANFSNSEHFLKRSSDLIDQIYDFLPNYSNKEPFLDDSEPITMSNEQGDIIVEIGTSMPFYSNEAINYIEPFEDTVYARDDILESERDYEEDLLNVIKSLKPANTSYLGSNEFSGGTGFTYNNSIRGVDSIAYGGLIR